MTQAVDNLTTSVGKLKDAVVASLALLDDLKTKLDAAIAAGNQDPAIQALADQIDSDTADIVAGVAKDTPPVVTPPVA